MEFTRDRFIDQFTITFQVHCLRGWSTRHKSAPTHLATCFYEWIKTNGGLISLSATDFARIAEPVIESLHRSTPKGQRPDANRLADLLYDALDAACVEVTLKPFVRGPKLNKSNLILRRPRSGRLEGWASTTFCNPGY